MMDIDKLQEFIQDQLHADVADKVYNDIMTDAETLDFDSFMQKWDKWLYENSEGWDSFRPNTKTIPERIREAFPADDKHPEINPFNVSEGEFRQKAEERFKDVDPKVLRENLSKMAQFYDEEYKEREAEAGRIRRTKEIEKDWSFPKKLLANEYSQARYIDDPNSTPFGKEGKFDPLDNKLELANIGLHGASLAGDAIPGVWGYVAGPGLRLGNDILQEAGDYGKDIGDLARDRALDLGTSFIGEAGPNALLRAVGRSEKLGAKLGKGIQETTDYADLLKQRKEMEELWNKWVKEPDHARRMKIINEIPDEGLKNRMLALESTKPRNTKGTPSYMSKREKERQGMVKNFSEDYKLREPEEAAKLLSKGDFDPHEQSWLNKLSETPVPGKTGRAVAKAINSKGIEYPLSFVKRKTVGTNLANPNIDKPKNKNDRTAIEWYKEHYAKDWLDANFKPRESSGLMYQAWKELMEENGREVK